MGFFGNLFGGSQPQQPDPDTSSTIERAPVNPYIQKPSFAGGIAHLLGGTDELDRESKYAAAAQQWQAQQDWAKAQQPQTPEAAPQQSFGSLSVSDGNTALGTPPMKDYTASPGPMDQIAAAAQSAPSMTGGTSIVDTGTGGPPRLAAPAQAPQAAAAVGAPPSSSLPPASFARTPSPMDLINSGAAARARAMGVDVGRSFADYTDANPGYKDDNTPQFWEDQNGGKHILRNGVDTLVAQPPVVRTLGNFDGSQSVVGINPYGTPGADGQADTSAPAPAAQSGPPTLSAPAGSRAARNNNPWNLRGGGNWQGMTGTDSGGFDQFDTPANGLRAAQINLANQQKLHGVNTIQDLIARESPSSDGNNVAAYVASVAKQTGFAPGQKLDFTDPATSSKVLQAIFNVEGGGTPQSAQSAQAAAAPQSTPAQSGPPMRGQSGPAAQELFRSQGFGNALANDGSIAGVSSDAIDRAAEKYNQTGVLDKLGMGKQSTVVTSAVMTRAAQRQAQGLDGGTGNSSLAGAKADFTANADSLKNMTTQRNAVSAFEKTAEDNLGIVEGLLKKGPGTFGAPILNRLQQHIRGQYQGDPDVTAYQTALNTVSSEYAKVMSGGAAGGTPTSDSARAHAAALLDPSYTPGQIQANVAVMRQEMANRIKEMDSQIQTTRGQINTNPAQRGAAPSAAPSAGPPMKTPAGPKVGDVQKGYRFVGGNPADPHSWTKA